MTRTHDDPDGDWPGWFEHSRTAFTNWITDLDNETDPGTRPTFPRWTIWDRTGIHELTGLGPARKDH